MHTDRRGLGLTAANAEAARQLAQTLEGYLAFRVDTGTSLKAALAADPQMPMAHCIAGYFLKLLGSRAGDERAARSAAAAEAAAAVQGASEREQLHIAALRAWCSHQWLQALAAWEAIVARWPHDVLALKLAQYLYFYRGDARGMRDSMARVLLHWSDEVPGHGYMLGCYAFGLEECGDYALAEQTGRAAIERNPADIWATHAVTHVLEMQDRTEEGLAWVEANAPHWDGVNFFVGHVWWHKALFHLERRELDAALALYDQRIWAAPSDQYLDICNAVSLLWRIEELGGSVGDRWEALLAKIEPRLADNVLPFADVHYAMALIAGRRDALLAGFQAQLKDEAAGDSQLPHDVSLSAMEALRDARTGNSAAACARLLTIRPALGTIGGSHAQRDLFERALIAAALAADRTDLGRTLLHERLERRPENRWAKAHASRLPA